MGTKADRLRQARIAAGYESAKHAADSMGIKESTYAHHENGIRGYDSKAAQYARKFKVSIDWLLTGQGEMPNTLRQIKYNSPMIAVNGIVQAGAWRSTEDSGAAVLPDNVPTSTEFPAEWQCAYVVVGQSLNKTAKDGDILICVDVIASGVDIEDGDLVIVERSRYSGQQIETTAKRIRKTISGFELWPESDRQEHQEPIALNGAEEGEEIRVAAKVVWIVKKP